MSEINVNKENFESIVLNNNKYVLVDFWAPWCGPCMMLSPILEEIAEQYDDKLDIAKINVDNNDELAMRYGISSIPTIILFKNGQALNTSVGYKSKADLLTHFQLNNL